MRIGYLAIPMLLAVSIPAIAQVSVRGYFKRDGTYVAPHMRSAPNGTTMDNWSTQGNVNPYTGQTGSVNPFPAPSIPQYRPYTPPQVYSPPVMPQYQAPNPYTRSMPTMPTMPSIGSYGSSFGSSQIGDCTFMCGED